MRNVEGGGYIIIEVDVAMFTCPNRGGRLGLRVVSRGFADS